MQCVTPNPRPSNNASPLLQYLEICRSKGIVEGLMCLSDSNICFTFSLPAKRMDFMLLKKYFRVIQSMFLLAYTCIAHSQLRCIASV